MAVVSQRETARTCEVSENGIREYTRTFLVQSDGPLDDPYQVGTSPGINFWDAYPTDPTAYFRGASINPRPDTNDVWWDVVCKYSNAPADSGQTSGGGGGGESGAPSGDPGQGGADVVPTDRPWNVAFDAVEFEKPLEQDVLLGDPCVATSGQLYDPPITVPGYRPQITYTGFKAIGDDSLANCANFVGKVNDAPWNGFPAQSVLCKKYSLSSQYEHGTRWWQKTVVVEIKIETYYDAEYGGEKTKYWNPVRVLDAGTYMFKDGYTSHPPQPILDLSGNPVSAAVPLDGHGKPLSAADILAGNYVWNSFNAYELADFTNIL